MDLSNLNAEERRKFHARERQRRFRERRSAEEIEEAKINDRERARLRRQQWTDEQRAEANRISREYMRERRRNSAQGLGTSTQSRNLNDVNNELVSNTINSSTSNQSNGCGISAGYLDYQTGETSIHSLRAQEKGYSSSHGHQMSGSIDSTFHHRSQKSEIIFPDQYYLSNYGQNVKRPSIPSISTLEGINPSHDHLNILTPPVHRENSLTQPGGMRELAFAASGARPSHENVGCSKINPGYNPARSSNLNLETMRRSLQKVHLPPMHVPDDHYYIGPQDDPNRSSHPLIHRGRPVSGLYQDNQVRLGQSAASQLQPAASLVSYLHSSHSSSRPSYECQNVSSGGHRADWHVNRIEKGKIP